MEIVILDGYTENPGDLSWDALGELGELTVYDRTANLEEAVTRIGDAGVAAVRTERNFRPRFDGGDYPLGKPFFVALAVRNHLRTRNAEMSQKLPCAARIFACYEFRSLKRFKSAGGQVGEIADGGRDYMKHYALNSALGLSFKTRNASGKRFAASSLFSSHHSNFFQSPAK